MKKSEIDKKKREAFFIIINIILSIFAFSFLISLTNIKLVYAENDALVKKYIKAGWELDETEEFLIKGDEKLKIETLSELGSGPTTIQKATGSSRLSGILNLPTGETADAIVSGLQHAGTAYIAVKMFGSILGLSKPTVDALSAAAFAGFGINKLFSVAQTAKKGFFYENFQWGDYGPAARPGLWGIGVGMVVFLLLYKKESKKLVTFECYPWEAPTGGADCEKCNSDIFPCSEYRCKSLGQACQLLNAGTDEEKCAWVNPRDVNSPTIEPWGDALTKDHNYRPDTAIRPPDRGVKILRDVEDGCIKAFTPLEFGILVNEPAQCKIDYNRTNSFDEMAYYFGGSNIFKYNHSQQLSLPGPDHMNAEAPELQHDGTYSLYIRCKDANGNENDDLFVFSFCVEEGPDVTPPRIEATSIANDMPFQYGLNQTELEVYVNEAADCKWDRVDMDYDNMEQEMLCSQHVWEMNNQMLYICKTTLTDLQDYKDNVFYFRCRDQPYLGDSLDRNINTESYKFVLKGTQPLTIKNVAPNGTITGYSTLATINLEVETDNGYNYGDSWCSYTTVKDATEDDYTEFFETGTNKHKQRLDLPAGEYIYYIQCVDLGANAAYDSTSFEVEIDSAAPEVVRVYQDSGKLRVITDEKSICSYSINEERECNFEINEGTNMPYVNSTDHYADWVEGKIFYIKCKDSNERQPGPESCSIIVRVES